MEISPATGLYCLFGNPVSHSMGPLVHNMLLNRLNIDAVYLAFAVDDIKKGIETMKFLGIKGASVTIPFKERIIEYLDEVDDTAIAIGAVNTVLNRGGKLFGCNTDCAGAVDPLRERCGDLAGKKVYIIGAGGAARAVAFGVKREGARITVVNRSIDKGEKLASQVGADFIPMSFITGAVCETENRSGRITDSAQSSSIEDADIIINTTSLGMTPLIENTPLDASLLKKEMTVMDIVYNPLQTRLLRDAVERGCSVVDGLSMFVHQGAAQFELFTGIKPPVQLMRETVMKKIS